MKKLERRLDLPAVVAISISAMLGGLFVLPGLAAIKTGPSVWLAFIAAGVCVLPAALSKSELATAMPTSGGTYVYLDRAFGPLAGTVSGLGLWISLLLKSAFALVGFSAYLFVLAEGVPIKGTALVLLGVILLLNVRGVRGLSQVQLVVVVLSLLAVGTMVIVGFAQVDFKVEAQREWFAHGTGGFLAAIGFVFISFAGVTKVAAIAEEIKSPNRNLPLAILVSLGVVTLIYGGAVFVMTSLIPMASLTKPDLHPVYSLAGALTQHPWLLVAAAVLGVITMTSVANAGLLAASRFPFAMSRERLLPDWMGALHDRYLTPHAAILLSGGVIAAAIMILDVEGIAKLASAFQILLFIAVNLAVVVLRETGVQWYRPGYKSPLYPWVQIFGILSGGVLIVILGPVALIASLGIAGLGVLLFVFYGRARTDRRGVIRLRGRRSELLRVPPPRVDEALVTGEAAVVVALFGKERSPERLVEIGHALAAGGTLEVVHLTEIPEQTAIDQLEEDRSVANLRRRIHELGREQDMPLEFEAIVTRDVLETVHQITSRLHCYWLVMEWGGRSRDTFGVYNPLSWLKDHLSCNLAVFYDAGVRDIDRILVHVEPGPHDALVLATADHLAMESEASLTFTRFVSDSEPLTTSQSAADYLDQVQKLSTAPSGTLLLHGRDEAATLGAATAQYDLLVTAGAPLRTFLLSSRSDRIVEKTASSVLKLMTPRSATHEALDRYEVRPLLSTKFMDFVNERCLGAQLSPMRKDAMLSHFAHAFGGALNDIETSRILAAFRNRERTQNTAVGDGIAIPHATLEDLDRTHLGVFTTSAPVDYQAPDARGVDVFFVTIGAPGDRQSHLVLLSTISKLALRTDLVENLRAAENVAQIRLALEKHAAELDV